MQGHTEVGEWELATVEEAAVRLRMSKSTVLRMIHSGRFAELHIRVLKPGRDWRIHLDDLDAYIASGLAPEREPGVPVLVRISGLAEHFLQQGIAELDDDDPLGAFAAELLERIEGREPSEARGFIADEAIDAELSDHARDARTRLPRRHPMRSGLNAITPQYL